MIYRPSDNEKRSECGPARSRMIVVDADSPESDCKVNTKARMASDCYATCRTGTGGRSLPQLCADAGRRRKRRDGLIELVGQQPGQRGGQSIQNAYLGFERTRPERTIITCERSGKDTDYRSTVSNIENLPLMNPHRMGSKPR